MAKTRCQCGSTILDQSDNIPYKGAIIRDQDKMNLYQSLERDITSFIDAISLSRREEWIDENYLRYDQDERPAAVIKNNDVIGFILARHLTRELCIYQCLSCGSVMIETSPFSNTFAIFTTTEWENGSASILQSMEQGGGPNFRLLA